MVVCLDSKSSVYLGDCRMGNVDNRGGGLGAPHVVSMVGMG